MINLKGVNGYHAVFKSERVAKNDTLLVFHAMRLHTVLSTGGIEY